MRASIDCGMSSYLTRLRDGVACISMTLVLLSGCGSGGGNADPDPIRGDPSALTDVDPVANQVLESSVPGTTVGLKLSLASTGSDVPRFSLRDDAGGAFTIDSVTGVVSLAAAVDFESSPVRSITARSEGGELARLSRTNG